MAQWSGVFWIAATCLGDKSLESTLEFARDECSRHITARAAYGKTIGPVPASVRAHPEDGRKIHMNHGHMSNSLSGLPVYHRAVQGCVLPLVKVLTILSVRSCDDVTQTSALLTVESGRPCDEAIHRSRRHIRGSTNDRCQTSWQHLQRASLGQRAETCSARQ